MLIFTGLIYWVKNLRNGLETRYEGLHGLSESAEKKAIFLDDVFNIPQLKPRKLANLFKLYAYCIKLIILCLNR